MFGRHDSLDLNTSAGGGRREAACEAQRIRQRLVGTHLVGRGPRYFTDYTHPGSVNRNENEIAVRQPSVVRCSSVEQIIVHVESVDRSSPATDQNASHASVLGGPESGVERSERSAGAGDSVAAGSQDITRDEDLVAPQSRRGNVEMGRRSRTATYSRIDLAEASI